MDPSVVKLKPIEATPETFKDFGQVIQASSDGEYFGPHDAQLDLTHGTPRLYIMHLQDRYLGFSTITHHANVTQCLGSIGGDVWYLGVAKPSIVDPDVEEKGANVLQSHSGHFFVPPAVDSVQVFKITGPKFLKLNRGTWHAGPLFKPDTTMDFYNLELSNTNNELNENGPSNVLLLKSTYSRDVRLAIDDLHMGGTIHLEAACNS